MMKTKFIMKAKRLLSSFVATAIAASMLPTLPAIAEETAEKYPYTLFAGSSEEGAITVNAGNFCVNGNVATNGTIVSSGNMNINGTKTENVGEETIYIIKKLNYAYFSGDNVDVYPDDYSYEEINININDPMAVQGELELTGNINLNTGIKALEDVNLNGEVKNTNSSVICSETGDIIIDSTNVNLNGLVYAPYGDVEITAQNLNLNNVIIIADTITFNCPSVNANYNNSMAELIGIESSDDLFVYSSGDYNDETNMLDIEWNTTYSKGLFEIFVSGDNEAYSLIYECEGEYLYSYYLPIETTKLYIKVVQTTDYGEKYECVPFMIRKNEDSFVLSNIDSDSDGLIDIYEKIYNSDINNPDTDDDGLTDYQEAFIVNTDLLVPDSFTSGVSDASADCDGDALSNIDEIRYNTDPRKEDTDNDGLLDYDEIYTYYSDPLTPDTDNDTILDGDEIKISLDPTNPETYGIPDAEHKIAQTISADSEVLSEINTTESPYKLSIDITAAGYVEGDLVAKKTSYSNAIQNDSMLGIAPELIYTNANSIDTVVLKFEISSEYVENTLNMFSDEEELTGIKRLNVFKYFEDLNMLIPIETQFDIENNIVYTNVDELGTYCVMDMELWLNSFEVPEEVYLSTPMLMSLPLENDTAAEFTTNDSIITFDGEIEDMVLSEDEIETEMVIMSETPMLMSLNTATNVTPIDVAFLLQSSGQLENTFTSQKTMILDVMEKLIDEYGDGNVRFCVVTYNLSGADMLEFADGEIWFTNYYALREALNAVSYTYTSGYTDRGNAFRMLQNNVDFRENASKFIFQVMNGSTDVGSMYFDQINTCSILGINYSELMPSGYYYLSPSYGQQVADAIASTNGMNATYSANSSIHVYNHICEYAAPPQVEFNAIVPTGWKTISLNGILDSENGVKSDDDTLTDWEEVMTEKLSWDTDGTVILPTIQQCISYATKPYAEDGLARFKSDQWISGMPSSDFERYLYYVINNTYILPIYSDPTEEDSDYDGFTDENDEEPLKFNEWEPETDFAHLVQTAGFSYNPQQDNIYSNLDNIQRFFGFSESIDQLAAFPLISKIDCEPIVFQDDNGNEFLLELWKGQYGLMAGAEIGLYYKPIEPREVDEPNYLYMFYNQLDWTKTADEKINYALEEGLLAVYSATEKSAKTLYQTVPDSMTVDMSMNLYKGNELILSRSENNIWWDTVFQFGNHVYNPSELALDAEITFDTYLMAESFSEALRNEGYINYTTLASFESSIGGNNNSYFCDGDTVYVYFYTYSDEDYQPDNQFEYANELGEVTYVMATLYNKYCDEQEYINTDPNNTTVDDILVFLNNLSETEIESVMNQCGTIYTTYEDVKKCIDFYIAYLNEPVQTVYTLFDDIIEENLNLAYDDLVEFSGIDFEILYQYMTGTHKSGKTLGNYYYQRWYNNEYIYVCGDSGIHYNFISGTAFTVLFLLEEVAAIC